MRGGGGVNRFAYLSRKKIGGGERGVKMDYGLLSNN